MTEQMIIIRAIILFLVLNYHIFFKFSTKILNSIFFSDGLDFNSCSLHLA